MINDSEIAPTHPVNAFRLKNFMGFADTGWVDLKSVTLLFGRNSSGKSGLIRALRFLRQNIDIPEGLDSLYFAREGGVDLGQFSDFIHKHDTNLPLIIEFNVWLSEEFRESDPQNKAADSFLADNEYASIKIVFSYDKNSRKLMLKSFCMIDGKHVSDENIFFETKLLDIKQEPKKGLFSHPFNEEFWSLHSDIIALDLGFEQNLWKNAKPKIENSFVPVISIPGNIQDTNVDRSEFEGRGDDFTFVTKLLRYFRIHIEEFLRSMTYIGPIREKPKRFYYVPQGISSRVGSRGQYAVERVFSQTSIEQVQEYIKLINDWLLESSLECKLHILPVAEDSSIYTLSIEEKSGFVANLQDVGFGISQLLPILIESKIVQDNRLIVIEQPELHLHPQAQADLGDLFALMAQQGTRFLLETHSEHLMLRFRRHIAETTLARLKGEAPKYPIDNGKFSLLFVYREDDHISHVEVIAVDYCGQLVEPTVKFRKFFEDDYVEVSELAKVNAMILELEG